ncbi:MAG TPA: hypothetical protein VF487_12495 [Chitinophagaceae bacterium]
MNDYGDSELSASRYSDEVTSYIVLLNKSFTIQTKKLEDAFADGIITEEEYDQWFKLYDRTRKECLSLDLTIPGNFNLFVKMAKHNMEIAEKLTFPRKS